MQKATPEELAKIDDEYFLELAHAGHITRMGVVRDFLIEWDSFYADQQLKEAQEAAKKEQDDAASRNAIEAMFEDYEAKKAALETDEGSGFGAVK
jgi:hypothetical protein